MHSDKKLYFKAVPYVKEEATLALESGADGLIVPDENLASAASLSRTRVTALSDVSFHKLCGKQDERALAEELKRADLSDAEAGQGPFAVLARGWEVIPLENLLAEDLPVGVEAGSLAEAELAAGVLEKGVPLLVLTREVLPELKAAVALYKERPESVPLAEAVVTRISPAGMGHRVCVDTTSLLHTGEGMLVGNSAAFTFLVNAETEQNEYVAARPFRVNAGGVHAYCLLPQDGTAYLEELAAGREVLVVSHKGEGRRAVVGRVKTERRPMLLVEAELADGSGGAVFLQNAETIRLVGQGGVPISVVDLAEGDRVLCRVDQAGRHFGMRIREDITER